MVRVVQDNLIKRQSQLEQKSYLTRDIEDFQPPNVKFRTWYFYPSQHFHSNYVHVHILTHIHVHVYHLSCLLLFGQAVSIVVDIPLMPPQGILNLWL